jgi:2-dehydro-3-deoxyphosphogluconate aldolase / (4S)-4-hydroxy-2-oxoglutarate aldolase
MNKVLEKIGQLGIVPVVKIEKAEDAIPLGKALIEGGLPIAEITFRTAAAEESISQLSKELPELLVGAGTVMNVEQAKKAVSAGAKFVVSAGFNPQVVDYCVENNIPITPGINNPTQIEMALAKGLDILKFFPAEASGGLPLLEAMSGPYGNVKYIPTGGINQNNLCTYLSNKKVHAVGGSWMVKTNLISSGQFDQITEITREAISIMLGFELAHLGINEKDEGRALNSASILSKTFSFPLKIGNSSIFAGSYFEVMKNKYLGEHGHIAIATNDISKAITYLEMKGVTVLPETAKESDGKLKAIYLNQEISGFAIHLIQK